MYYVLYIGRSNYCKFKIRSPRIFVKLYVSKVFNLELNRIYELNSPQPVEISNSTLLSAIFVLLIGCLLINFLCRSNNITMSRYDSSIENSSGYQELTLFRSIAGCTISRLCELSINTDNLFVLLYFSCSSNTIPSYG